MDECEDHSNFDKLCIVSPNILSTQFNEHIGLESLLTTFSKIAYSSLHWIIFITYRVTAHKGPHLESDGSTYILVKCMPLNSSDERCVLLQANVTDLTS